MANHSVFPPAVVAVTSGTEVFSIDSRQTQVVTVQIDNLDASQTFAGVIQSRLDSSLPWASSTFPDFSAVLPLTSVVAQLDTRQLSELKMSGTMSGLGGNVRVTVKDLPL